MELLHIGVAGTENSNWKKNPHAIKSILFEAGFVEDKILQKQKRKRHL